MPDFCLFFTFNLNGSNFDLLACKLGELYIKNSHPMITYNILGTSSSIFIEFCGIEFSANMVPWPISETLCCGAQTERGEFELGRRGEYHATLFPLPN